MFSLKSFFRKRCELIAKSKGLTRAFAYGEMVCFPVSLGVIAVVLAHALWTLAVPLLARVGVGLVAPVPLPAWFTSVFVAAAIGYLTNYVAIQMLYYPVSPDDLSGDADDARREREALSKSRILSLVTLGFWKKGLIPQNKDKVARQMGRIAEERFVTAENLSYLLSKFGALCVSKNAEGKVRGVEFIRRLAVAHKDEVAGIIQWIGRDVVTGDNYQTVRNLLARIGRSEALANALAAALFDYMEKNPESVVSFVREMVSGFTDAQTSKADRSGSLWEQIKAGATGFIVEAVASIGYPQIRSFLEDYVRDPQHRAEGQLKGKARQLDGREQQLKDPCRGKLMKQGPGTIEHPAAQRDQQQKGGTENRLIPSAQGTVKEQRGGVEHPAKPLGQPEQTGSGHLCPERVHTGQKYRRHRIVQGNDCLGKIKPSKTKLAGRNESCRRVFVEFTSSRHQKRCRSRSGS